MATPTIFTRTPIEGVIQATGMEAQVAIASTILGTPAFWGGAMVFFMWRFGNQLYAVGVGERTPLQGGRTALTAFLMVLLGWTLLGARTGEGDVHVGPVDARDSNWSELAAVKENRAYKPLVEGSTSLWGYHFVNSVVEELTGQVHGAVKAASSAPEPTDQILGLMSLQATSLGVDHAPVANAFNKLSANCRGSAGAKILERGAGARDLFDLSSSNCSRMWDEFDGAFTQAKGTVISEMGAKFGDRDSLAVSDLGIQFGADLLFGGDQDDVENMAFSIAMENYVNDQAGRTALNSQRQTGATFSDGAGDAALEGMASGSLGEFALGVMDMLPWSGDVHARARKAETASKFNEYADLIPSLRGFLHALFAVVYPLCAYALACGFSRPFLAWLGGRFLLGLYTPAATLLYAMTSSLTQQSRIANDPSLAWVANDEFTLGGVALLEGEILRIQSSYLMCEMAVFTGFLIGSASILRGGFNTNSNIQGGAASAVRTFRSVGGGAVVGAVAGKAVDRGRAVLGSSVSAPSGRPSLNVIGSSAPRSAPASPVVPTQSRRLLGVANGHDRSRRL